MAGYRFLTTWLIEAPVEPLFDAIHASERWPEWWRGVRSVERLEDGPDGSDVGAVGRYVWRSRIPYPVVFETRITRIERPHLLEGEASGELAGRGTWRLFEHEGLTAVVYDWDVRTTRAWMNLLAPVAGPVFRWNHDWVMARGGEGLAKLLGARLVASA
ncbi:MAG TPA: SRPBCC family protein [Thermoleophilaceae bacterium]|nr:SRPBCC family protein [Thermoleophilaceae bacterium]